METLSRVGKAVDEWLGRRQYAIGKYYVARNRYSRAIVAFEAAEKWYIEKYGPQHSNVVAALIQLGWCNGKMDRTRAACQAYRRALDIIEQTVGLEHPKAREIQAYLAWNCHEE